LPATIGAGLTVTENARTADLDADPASGEATCAAPDMADLHAPFTCPAWLVDVRFCVSGRFVGGRSNHRVCAPLVEPFRIAAFIRSFDFLMRDSSKREIWRRGP
jgi:hypothetical protein